MGFAGTISISQETYRNLCGEIFHALERHGFRHIYILNGHGANLEPLAEAADAVSKAKLRIKSWWDFEAVNLLRQALYGDWEGMHATPSEIAITQVAHRGVDAALASAPPEKLTQDFVRTHAGDKHGSADEHRAQFPDGRVGSHSALATRAHGARLKAAAVSALIKDYEKFVGS
jgi:creatinine amidohydrolase